MHQQGMQAELNVQLVMKLSQVAGLQQPIPGLPHVELVWHPIVQKWLLVASTMQSYPDLQVVLPLQPLPGSPLFGRQTYACAVTTSLTTTGTHADFPETPEHCALTEHRHSTLLDGGTHAPPPFVSRAQQPVAPEHSAFVLHFFWQVRLPAPSSMHC